MEKSYMHVQMHPHWLISCLFVFGIYNVLFTTADFVVHTYSGCHRLSSLNVLDILTKTEMSIIKYVLRTV